MGQILSACVGRAENVGNTAPWNIDLLGDPEIRIPDEYFRGVPTLLSLYIYGIHPSSGRDW
jgi:hypothetical protein